MHISRARMQILKRAKSTFLLTALENEIRDAIPPVTIAGGAHLSSRFEEPHASKAAGE